MGAFVASVSVRVPKEDVYSHSDLTFWTYIHCKRLLHRQFWTFWAYFSDVKTSVWALTETLLVPFTYNAIKYLTSL